MKEEVGSWRHIATPLEIINDIPKDAYAIQEAPSGRVLVFSVDKMYIEPCIRKILVFDTYNHFKTYTVQKEISDKSVWIKLLFEPFSHFP